MFPGAEGFGTDTPGGRGGDVVIVQNLDAEGPGSLQDAVSGPDRIVVFAVGGTIRITEDLRLLSPRITIFGETAPAPGVTIVGAGLLIETHDVYISHLAVRTGDFEEGPNPDVRDAITIARSPEGPTDADVGNIVIDHCSLSWGVDETASTSWDLVHDVTFSNNIIAEGLKASLHSEGEHSKGLIVGSGSRRIAVLSNLFAHNNDRSPVVSADTSSVVAGNVVYNPGDFGTVHYGLPGCCPAWSTIVGNRVIPGPDTPEDRGHPVHITERTHVDSRFFLDDNCGGENRIEVIEPVEERPVKLTPLTIGPCSELPDTLLPNVGARPWDRAADDVRVVGDVTAGTGSIVDTPPGMDALLAQEPTSHELDLPENPNEDDDADGYTAIESWAFGLRVSAP